ncbi:MAG: VCBS repeat-containing protein [Deltaproteobacteria bacterium]|nr:VCBS repeat-containing protein [Deltaproteobacteria bacterium]MBW2537576.1 VCBS repeat-containing protein [Deltaproteobacteria bacterium]
MKSISFAAAGVLGAAALTAHPVSADLPQKAGWPIQLPAGTSGGYVLAPQHNVALVDLDGQPGQEVVASSGDQVVVWRSDGTVLPGWPAAVQGAAQAPPSVGDVDGDGVLDIVQAGRGLQYSDTSHLHVFSAEGVEKPGWPLAYPNLIMHAASLADVSQDGALDLLVQLGAWPPAGTFLALTGGAQPLGSSWEHSMDSYPLACPAVGDLDGDGVPEIAYLTLAQVTVRRADGQPLAGFPRTATAGYEHTGSIVMADLDPDRPGLELTWAEILAGGSGGPASLFVADAAGASLPGFPVEIAAGALGVAPLSVGDVTGDGALEVVAPANDAGVVVVAATAQVIATVPATAQLMASVQLVDLDGNGQLELVADNNTGDADGRGYLEGWLLDGTSAPDFPLRPQGVTMANGASVGDLDADGVLELVAVSSELTDPPATWVNVWSLPGAAIASDQWGTFAGGPGRTNCHRCDGNEPASPADDAAEDGCSCAMIPSEPAPLAPGLMALLGLSWAARRRSPRPARRSTTS